MCVTSRRVCVTWAGEYGWPTSTVLPKIPETDEEKAQLIDTLQDWKTEKYQQIICEHPPAPCGTCPDHLALKRGPRHKGALLQCMVLGSPI
jgi:hypothetical protein